MIEEFIENFYICRKYNGFVYKMNSLMNQRSHGNHLLENISTGEYMVKYNQYFNYIDVGRLFYKDTEIVRVMSKEWMKLTGMMTCNQIVNDHYIITNSNLIKIGECEPLDFDTCTSLDDDYFFQMSTLYDIGTVTEEDVGYFNTLNLELRYLIDGTNYALLVNSRTMHYLDCSTKIQYTPEYLDAIQTSMNSFEGYEYVKLLKTKETRSGK